MLPSPLSTLLRNEHGGPVAEYAVIAAIFALAMLSTMQLIKAESAGQLVGTQNRLTTTQLSLPTPRPTGT